MTFEKARGLRAHKWQAHTESKKSKKQLLPGEKVEQLALKEEVEQTEHSLICVESNPQNMRSVPRPGSSSAEAPPPLKTVSSEVKQKMEISDAADEVPPPASRIPESTVKYLFKCDKCGKAFQTKEQLESHKNKAKSRPHCCALCCHGFWTENQLQQHLAWHDQVRCRLPNEVRLWLSSAVSTKPFKPGSLADGKGRLPQTSATGEPIP